MGVTYLSPRTFEMNLRDEAANTTLPNALLRDHLDVELLVSETRDWDDRLLRTQGRPNEPVAALPLQAVRVLGVAERLLRAARIHQDELVVLQESDGCCGLTFNRPHHVRQVAKERSRKDDPVAERTNPSAGPLEDECEKDRKVDAEMAVVGDQQRAFFGRDVFDSLDRRLQPFTQE
jgi:hypothetical protein